MRVQITARHGEVPESVRERTETRIKRLSRFEPRLSSAEVVFEEESHARKVEGILSIDGDEAVVANGEGSEFRDALDVMTDRLAKILRRRRSQARDHQGPSLNGRW